MKRVVLEALALRDYRNIERLDVDLPPAGMVIVGDNGHGKSNLLEAVYYLHVLRAMRGARDADAVRFGEAGFHIAACAQGPNREVSVGFERQSKKKRVKLDGVEPTRLSDALGALPCVLFSPADVELVAGAPNMRRRYLDILLALSSKHYLSALQRYRHALAQRNAALRDAFKSSNSAAHDRIAVWEAPLAQHGAAIWNERVRWADSCAERFAEMCGEIGEVQPVSMRYASSLVPASRDASEMVAALLKGHEERRTLDIKRGLTHTGPHRDDLTLSLGGRALQTFGSAGQQRTAAIALRLLESSTLRKRLGLTPLLLLDDPFAELDANRSARILELLARDSMGQTLLTVPRESDIPPALTQLSRWRISGGVLTEGVA